jgi:hypothetical protein
MGGARCMFSLLCIPSQVSWRVLYVIFGSLELCGYHSDLLLVYVLLSNTSELPQPCIYEMDA